jgi:ABC-type Na+ transport system ATPase subunit NatA
MSGRAIEVKGLTKVFNRSLVAVDHISFNVEKGEIFGFLGPNGAGRARGAITIAIGVPLFDRAFRK